MALLFKRLVYLLCFAFLCLIGYVYLSFHLNQHATNLRETHHNIVAARNSSTEFLQNIDSCCATSIGGTLQSLAISKNVCSSESLYHKNKMKKYLLAWYNFVPQQRMSKSNCWYAQNMNTLPGHMVKKMKELATFVDVPSLFGNDTEYILSNIFQHIDKSHSAYNFFCLPRNFLIGFPKCGTTLLYEYIQLHPLFASPQVKEGQFWREFVKTSDSQLRILEVLLYLFHFSGASQKMRHNSKLFTMDASASTVFASALPLKNVEEDMCFVPLLIHKTLPLSKIIIIMRDPVDRLWSDFWYFCPPSKWKSFNIQSDTAAELFHNITLHALKNFSDCISGNSLFHCATVLGSIAGEEVACSNVRLGLSIYYPHVLRWYSVFSQNQLLLMRMEDLISDASSTMHLVWKFLEVPMSKNKILKEKVNSNPWITKEKYSSRIKMLLPTKLILTNFFSPYNQKLASLLNDDHYLWSN